MKMEKNVVKLGEFKVIEDLYVAFYNDHIDGVDYYYRNDEENLVECITIKRSMLKKIVGKNNDKGWFKLNNQLVFKLAIAKDIYEEVMTLQTFEIDMWNIVLRGFDDVSLKVLTELEAEKFRNSK